MARMTRRREDGAFVLPADSLSPADGVWAGPAAEKLAAYENLGEELCAQQAQLSQKMADLRAAGRERTVQFRELMAQKLSNAYVISLLQARGLMEKEDGSCGK